MKTKVKVVLALVAAVGLISWSYASVYIFVPKSFAASVGFSPIPSWINVTHGMGYYAEGQRMVYFIESLPIDTTGGAEDRTIELEDYDDGQVWESWTL